MQEFSALIEKLLSGQELNIFKSGNLMMHLRYNPCQHFWSEISVNLSSACGCRKMCNKTSALLYLWIISLTF